MEPAGPAPTVALLTLGCKVNQADGEWVAARLRERGVRVAASLDSGADAVIVNTCTVTATADHKSRKAIRRAAASGAPVIVMGCYAEVAAEAASALPGVVDVFPPSRREDVVEAVARLVVCQADAAPESVIQSGTKCCEESHSRSRPGFLASAFAQATADKSLGMTTTSGMTGPRHRPIIKVQDGCDHRCAYCIVPLARGRERSRPPEEVLAEIRQACQSGAREVVLAGVRLGAYRMGDHAGRPYTLADLVRRAGECLDGGRLRLSSIEPWDVTSDLIAAVAETPAVCPHWHLPVQSGDDAVLRAMGRPYGGDDLLRLADAIRERSPDAALSADVMVGFPGEGRQQFEATLRLIEHMGFMRVHVFPYSPRPGTAAAAMPDQVPPQEKAARARAVARRAQALWAEYARRFVGARVEVLTETSRNGFVEGVTRHYLRARVSGEPTPVDGLVCARVERLGGGWVEAVRQE